MIEASELHSAVKAAANGEEEAFRFLYELSFPCLKKEALKLMRNEEDADDALSQTYLQVFKSLNKLADADKFIPWAKKVCRNICIRESVRKSRMEKSVELRPSFSEEEYEGMDVFPADFYDRRYDPQAYAEASETKDLLDRIIGELPRMQRICIMLWQEEYSIREISYMTGLPEGTVKSNVRYAKEKIREKVMVLEKQGVKLYGMTPVIFFLWVVSEFDRTYVPAKASAAGLDSIIAAMGMSSIKSAAVQGAAAASRAAGIGIGKRAALIALCAGIAGGGITLGVLNTGNSRGEEIKTTVAAELTPAPAETVIAPAKSESAAKAANTEEPDDQETVPMAETEETKIYHMKHFSFVMPDAWAAEAEAVITDEDSLNIYAYGVLIAGIYAKDTDDEGYAGDAGFSRFRAKENSEGKRIELWMPRLTERIPHDEKFPYDDELNASEEEKERLIALTTGNAVTLEECRKVYEADDTGGRKEIWGSQDKFYLESVWENIYEG